MNEFALWIETKKKEKRVRKEKGEGTALHGGGRRSTARLPPPPAGVAKQCSYERRGCRASVIEQLAVVGEKRTMFEVELSCGKEVDSSYFLRIELNLWIGCLFTGRKIWWSLARMGGSTRRAGQVSRCPKVLKGLR